MAKDIETTLQQQDMLIFHSNKNFHTKYFRTELGVQKIYV